MRTSLMVLAALLVLAIVALPTEGMAQARGYNSTAVKSGAAYAVDQIDTLPSASGSWQKLGGAVRIELMTRHRDSVYSVAFLDSRPIGATTWTALAVDSITAAVGHAAASRTSEGIWHSYVWRSNAAETAAGIGYEYRIRFKYMDWGCGGSSATYDAWLNWK